MWLDDQILISKQIESQSMSYYLMSYLKLVFNQVNLIMNLEYI